MVCVWCGIVVYGVVYWVSLCSLMMYLMVYDMHLFYLIGDACGVCGVYVGVCVHHVVFF